MDVQLTKPQGNSRHAHRSVNWASVTIENDLQLTVLKERLDQYAYERGKLRADTSDRSIDLRHLDSELAAELSAWAPVLQADPELAQQLFLKFNHDEVITRISVLQETVSELAEKIGASFVHHPKDCVMQLQKTLNNYYKQQADLFAQYPEVRSKIEEVRAHAEDHGLRSSVEAERAATYARSDLIWRKINPFYDRQATRLWRELLKFESDQLALVNSAYKDRYGQDLAKLSEKYYLGIGGEQVSLLLQGKLPEAFAVSLDIALSKKCGLKIFETEQGYRYKNILRAVEEIPVDLLSEVIEQFNRNHAHKFSGENYKPCTTLTKAIESKISNPFYCSIIKARLRGEIAYTDSIKLRSMIRSGSEGSRKALKLVESYLTQGKLDQLKKAFHDAFPAYKLDVYVQKFYPAGLLKKGITAALNNDMTGLRYAKLCFGLKYLKGIWIGEAFNGAEPDIRKELTDRYYKEHNAEVMHRLRYLRGNARSYLSSIIENGGLLPWEKLRYAMEGWGTDVELIKNVFANNTSAENDFIAQKYNETYINRNPGFFAKLIRLPLINRIFFNGELEHDLRKEILSGDDAFDINEARKGKPANDLERYFKIKRVYQHEESARYLIKYSNGQRLHDTMYRLNEFYEKQIKNKTPSHRDLRYFRALMDLVEIDLKPFRMFKQKVSPLIPDIAAGAVTTASLIMTTKFGLPWHVCLMSAFVVCMSTLTAAKRSAKGDGYGLKDFFVDWSVSAINAATFYSGRLFLLFGQAFSSWVTNSAIKGATKTGMKQAVKFAERFGKRSRELSIVDSINLQPQSQKKELDLTRSLQGLNSHSAESEHDTRIMNIWKIVLQNTGSV